MHPLDTVGVGLNPSSVGPRGSSPGPSPSLRRRPHHQLQNLVLGSSPRSHHGHSIQNHSQNASPVSWRYFWSPAFHTLALLLLLLNIMFFKNFLLTFRI